MPRPHSQSAAGFQSWLARGLTEGISPSVCSGPGGACLLSPSCQGLRAGQAAPLSAGREGSPLGVAADRDAPLGTETGARSAWVTIPALTTAQPSDSGCGLFTFPGLFSLLQPSPPTRKHPGPAAGRGYPLLPRKVASLGPQTRSQLTPPDSLPRQGLCTRLPPSPGPARFTKNSGSLPGWARKPVAGQEAAPLHQGSNEQPVH